LKKRFFPRFFYSLPYTEEDLQAAAKNAGETLDFPEDFISAETRRKIDENRLELLAQQQYIDAHPKHIIINRLSWILLLFVVGSLGIILFNLENEPLVQYRKHLIMLSFVVITGSRVFATKSRSLIKDFVKQKVAKKNSWLYDPKLSYEKADALNTQFPHVFFRGDQSISVEDEFYGVQNVESKSYYFNSGLYTYKIKKRRRKGITRYKTIRNHYICIKLVKPLSVEFLLKPEIAGGIFNVFNSKEIDLESDEFNKLFSFSYTGKKEENSAEIVKNLSPAVQLGLIDLAKRRPSFRFFFSKNTLVFLFRGELVPSSFIGLSTLKTKSYNYSGVKNEDVERIENEIKNITDLAVSITKYLD